MYRCLQLAQLGSGCVSPNPMVGAVVVYDNRIIGEGYHQYYGGNHAEVNAINSVEDKGLLRYSTLYVNLEPCSHWGKTPPCTELIIKHRIKKVVIANMDVNPKVAGNGVRTLQENGIEVITGVLEEEARSLNKYFFTYFLKKRPYITLKWAETLDGFMDIERREGDEKEEYWITNDALRVYVHKQRAEVDCILAGRTTILNDNPKLNLRYYLGNNPIRMTIDKDLTLPEDLFFFDNTQKTILFNSKRSFEEKNTIYYKIDFEKDVLEQIIHYIYSINKNSLVVEGGKQTLESFINLNLWDEANVLVGNKYFNKGLLSPKGLIEQKFVEKTYYNTDWIEYYYNR